MSIKKKEIVLDQEHMEHIHMLLSYGRFIPDDYGRALVKRIKDLENEIEVMKMLLKAADEGLRKSPSTKLWTRAEEAEKTIDELRAALKKFGHHTYQCDVGDAQWGQCTCGLWKLTGEDKEMDEEH